MGPSGLTLSLSSTPHSATGGGSGVSAEGAKRLLVGRLWRGCRCREEDASGGPLSLLFRRRRFAGFFSPRRSEPGCASVSLRVQLRGRSGSRGRSARLGLRLFRDLGEIGEGFAAMRPLPLFLTLPVA
jgi:hypothetical protein